MKVRILPRQPTFPSPILRPHETITGTGKDATAALTYLALALQDQRAVELKAEIRTRGRLT